MESLTKQCRCTILCHVIVSCKIRRSENEFSSSSTKDFRPNIFCILPCENVFPCSLDPTNSP